MNRCKQPWAGLHEAARLYQDCLDLTRQALAGEEEFDLEALEALLKKRSVILDRIKNIEKATAEAEAEGGPTADDQDRAALKEKIRDIIRQLTEADLSLRQKIQSQLDQTRHSLKRFGQGRRILKGYKPFRSGDSLYVNRSG